MRHRLLFSEHYDLRFAKRRQTQKEVKNSYDPAREYKML